MQVTRPGYLFRETIAPGIEPSDIDWESVATALEETGSVDPATDIATICMAQYKEYSSMTAIAQVMIILVIVR